MTAQQTIVAQTSVESQAHNLKMTMATPISSDSLRLLIVTPRYFPYMGGVETHVYETARRLAKLNVDVTVLTTDPNGQWPANEQSEGVKIQRVRAWPANRDYYYAPGIYPIIQRGKWDIIHIQSYHTLVAPLAMWAARRAQIPYIVTFHGGGHSSRLRNQLRGIQHALLRPLLARSARLVAVAAFEIGFYGKRLRLPPEKFVLIPNGADITKMAPPATLSSENRLIASVGRLERYKGHQRIIAALPYILQHQPDTRLWIAGQGPYEAELRRLAEKLGVADRVEIRGIPATDREMMATELSKAGLVTVLSDYETHPIAALEALALGRSLLVTDTSGLRELAERGLARAVSLHSTPQEVAAAVIEQLHNPVMASEFSLSTWDDCARNLLQLYQVCRKRQPSLG